MARIQVQLRAHTLASQLKVRNSAVVVMPYTPWDVSVLLVVATSVIKRLRLSKGAMWYGI